MRPGPADAAHVYVDGKVRDYATALITATDPRRTEGILSGARFADGATVIEAAQVRAHTAGRRFVTPDDVKRSALEILPPRILMADPEGDARWIVRAILDVVEVP
jgi:MoxR-like ATPase